MEWVLISLALWLLVGWFTARVMKGKGRSAFIGWTLGLLFGVFGLLFCAVLPARHRALLVTTPRRRMKLIRHGG